MSDEITLEGLAAMFAELAAAVAKLSPGTKEAAAEIAEEAAKIASGEVQVHFIEVPPEEGEDEDE